MPFPRPPRAGSPEAYACGSCSTEQRTLAHLAHAPLTRTASAPTLASSRGSMAIQAKDILGIRPASARHRWKSVAWGIRVEPLNLGVIGVGQMGSVHARQMAELDEVRVIAVADVDSVRAQAIGEATGARVFPDARTLLRRGDVDAILIATPHPLHAPIAADAA